MDFPGPDRPLAVIGLGLIGTRLARRFIDRGYDVRGFDIDRTRCQEFESVGGIAASSAAEATRGCAAALLSLPDSDSSRLVCLGEGGLADLESPPGFVYDTTTGRPEDAAYIAAALEARGLAYSDATLSGNSEMAERGELLVMVGGTGASYSAGVPLFEVIGRAHHHVGGPGSGARMKLLVNHVLTIHRLALAEGLLVAELAGMDLTSALGVLRDSLAYSRAMDAWGDRMAAGHHQDPASRLRQGHKDARLILDHAAALHAPVELIEIVRAVLAEGEEAGLGDFDNSAVMEVLRRRAGRGRLV